MLYVPFGPPHQHISSFVERQAGDRLQVLKLFLLQLLQLRPQLFYFLFPLTNTPLLAVQVAAAAFEVLLPVSNTALQLLHLRAPFPHIGLSSRSDSEGLLLRLEKELSFLVSGRLQDARGLALRQVGVPCGNDPTAEVTTGYPYYQANQDGEYRGYYVQRDSPPYQVVNAGA